MRTFIASIITAISLLTLVLGMAADALSTPFTIILVLLAILGLLMALRD